MKLKIKLLDENAKVPTKAYFGDAGIDFYSLYDTWVHPQKSNVLPTGVSMEIPQGYFGLMKSRSSLAMKYGCNNTAGVVDAGYRGEVRVVLSTVKPFEIKAGDKIAQMVILPIPDIELEEVEELSNTQRGRKGFGSSGK